MTALKNGLLTRIGRPKVRRMRRPSVAASAIAAITALLLSATPASAQLKAPGEYFEIDFTAAAPASYNHLTGGGAYDTGKTNIDTVQSLEGRDFVCGVGAGQRKRFGLNKRRRSGSRFVSIISTTACAVAGAMVIPSMP